MANDAELPRFVILKHWLCVVLSDVLVEAQSLDQYWLQVLQFSMDPADLLSILLRCNGFAGIQKGVVDKTSSRQPNSDHDLFFGASLTLGSAWELLLSLTTELVTAGCHIKSTFC